MLILGLVYARHGKGAGIPNGCDKYGAANQVRFRELKAQ